MYHYYHLAFEIRLITICIVNLGKFNVINLIMSYNLSLLLSLFQVYLSVWIQEKFDLKEINIFLFFFFFSKREKNNTHFAAIGSMYPQAPCLLDRILRTFSNNLLAITLSRLRAAVIRWSHILSSSRRSSNVCAHCDWANKFVRSLWQSSIQCIDRKLI